MKILVNGEIFEVEVLAQSRGEVRFAIDSREYEVSFAEQTPSSEATSAPASKAGKKLTHVALEEDGSIIVSAPMPGVVTELSAAQGDAVESGQALLQIEAMKMQNGIFAAVAGTVSELYVSVGDEVSDEQPLLKISRGKR